MAGAAVLVIPRPSPLRTSHRRRPRAARLGQSCFLLPGARQNQRQNPIVEELGKDRRRPAVHRRHHQLGGDAAEPGPLPGNPSQARRSTPHHARRSGPADHRRKDGGADHVLHSRHRSRVHALRHSVRLQPAHARYAQVPRHSRQRDHLLVPSQNPDGLDIVTRWYRKTLGTPYEGTSPPELYQKYVGHDNNRDWYIFRSPKRGSRCRLQNAWHPQIVYDVHQQGLRIAYVRAAVAESDRSERRCHSGAGRQLPGARHGGGFDGGRKERAW
jgi:hypothetical protein